MEENFLGFTEDQVEEFREVFTIFDKDKNGIIDIKEMGVVMRALGQDPSRQRLEEIIREFDENKDGVISFDEFLELMAAMINKVDEVSYLDGERGSRRSVPTLCFTMSLYP